MVRFLTNSAYLTRMLTDISRKLPELFVNLHTGLKRVPQILQFNMMSDIVIKNFTHPVAQGYLVFGLSCVFLQMLNSPRR